MTGAGYIRSTVAFVPGPVGTGKTMLMNLFDEESRKAPTKLTGKFDLSKEMKAFLKSHGFLDFGNDRKFFMK